VQTLNLDHGYWRYSKDSIDLFKCYSSDTKGTPCVGGNNASLCVPGQEGPECKVCSQSNHREDDGFCEECPDAVVPMLLIFILFAVCIGVFAFLRMLVISPPKLLQPLVVPARLIIGTIVSLGPSKGKVAVTYYQVIASLPSTFDIDPMPDDFGAVLSSFSWVDVEWSTLVFPVGCLDGGYVARMLIVSLMPYMLILFVTLLLFAYGFMLACSPADADSPRGSGGRLSVTSSPTKWGGAQKRDVLAALKGRAPTVKNLVAGGKAPEEGTAEDAPQDSWLVAKVLQVLPIGLLVVFTFLPSISRSIFFAWGCKGYNKGPYSEDSFMTRDLSVQCGTGEHDDIVGVAIVLVILWPVGMMTCFSFLLVRYQDEFRSGEPKSAYARATKFLTGGYKPKFFYWEIIELTRRLAICGWVVLIPYDQIYGRSLFCLFLSVFCFGLTAYCQPCRLPEDNVISILAQGSLIVAFVCCQVILITRHDGLLAEQLQHLLGFHEDHIFFFVLCFMALGFFLILFAIYMSKFSQAIQEYASKQGREFGEHSSTCMLFGTISFGLIAALLGGIFGGVVGGVLCGACFAVLGAICGLALAHPKTAPNFVVRRMSAQARRMSAQLRRPSQDTPAMPAMPGDPCGTTPSSAS